MSPGRQRRLQRRAAASVAHARSRSPSRRTQRLALHAPALHGRRPCGCGALEPPQRRLQGTTTPPFPQRRGSSRFPQRRACAERSIMARTFSPNTTHFCSCTPPRTPFRARVLRSVQAACARMPAFGRTDQEPCAPSRALRSQQNPALTESKPPRFARGPRAAAAGATAEMEAWPEAEAALSATLASGASSLHPDEVGWVDPAQATFKRMQDTTSRHHERITEPRDPGATQRQLQSERTHQHGATIANSRVADASAPAVRTLSAMAAAVLPLGEGLCGLVPPGGILPGPVLAQVVEAPLEHAPKPCGLIPTLGMPLAAGYRGLGAARAGAGGIRPGARGSADVQGAPCPLPGDLLSPRAQKLHSTPER